MIQDHSDNAWYIKGTDESTLRGRNLKTQLFISTVSPTVTKTELFENYLQTGGIWKRRLFVFAWTENILKTELFENDGVTIIMWFPRPTFSQTQIQTDRGCWVFKFLRRSVDGKHLMPLVSEQFLTLLESVTGVNQCVLTQAWIRNLLRKSKTYFFLFLGSY